MGERESERGRVRERESERERVRERVREREREGAGRICKARGADSG